MELPSLESLVEEGDDSFRVVYPEESLVVDVAPEHADSVLQSISKSTREERRRVLSNTKRALRENARVLRAGRITPAEQQNMADDVCIWWAFEYLAGRGLDHVIEKSPPVPVLVLRDEEGSDG